MPGGERKWKPQREVRLAIVMYGGVSLAIYIYGVAQELERLVRATAQDSDDSDFALAESDLNSTDRVYRAIGRARGGDGGDDWCEGKGEGDPALSRFVVDILSGTSAGGINAIYLAKAMANGQSIEALRKLWIEEADIDKLFNRPEAYADLAPGVEYTKPPASLLAGDRLYVRALEALTAMGEERVPGAPNFADQVDLSVTTTDLQGLTEPIQLADMAIKEPRHRATLRFGYVRRDWVKDGGGDFEDRDSNEFQKRDKLLAFAARATSSFPVAFAPAVLSAVTRGFDRKQADDLFPDYARIGADYPNFAFADGGYLDNKPFTGATETLRRRRADIPVDRKLIYVEPDPKDPTRVGKPTQARKPPDAAANAADALVRLPRQEPIRGDIAAISDRNAAVRRVREVTRGIELTAIDPEPEFDMHPALVLAYLRLRRLQVVEDLTELVARTSREPPTAEQRAAIQAQIEESARGRRSGAEHTEEGQKEAIEPLRAFLNDFDMRYRVRRVALLQDRINDLIEGGEDAAALLRAARVDGDAAELARAGRGWLLSRKEALSKILVKLGRDWRRVRVTTRAERSAPSSVVEAASALNESQDEGRATDLGDALKAALGSWLVDADRDIQAALADTGHEHPPELTRVLQLYDGCVEVIDMAVFPLTYPDLGEVNPIDVYRVSPQDAPALVDPTPQAPKLAGISVGHFGGFLAQDWRRNDLMWGRLDAAERLIDILVPVESARGPLRDRAHAQILREESASPEFAHLLTAGGYDRLRAALESGDDAKAVSVFKSSYVAHKWELDSDRELELAGRSMAIAGGMLDGIAKERHLGTVRAIRVAPLGHLLRGFAKVRRRVRGGH
jgi:hypothetical protein